METKHATWQERHGLTICPAAAIESAIPTTALGVAVIYSPASAEGAEKIFLVIESRATGLRDQCARRLETAKLPSLASLVVAFTAEVLTKTSPETVHAACRQQVILAGELRRELRPAMR